MKKGSFYLIALLLTCLNALSAQTDSLILKNGNVIVGEAKELRKGVLIVETVYSDTDFKIEWNGIKEIYTESRYLITLSSGKRFNGKIETTDSAKVNLYEEGDTLQVDILDVVYLKSIDSGFWSQIYASVDLGYGFTKANNLSQLSIRGNLGYVAERWSVDASFNTVDSRQDSVETIRRTDGGLIYKVVLPKGWYVFSELTFLSNTEQKLQLRTNAKLGIGKYLIQTNKAYWGLQGGASFNFENYSTEAVNRESVEAFIGTELNLFDIGDLNLLTKANVYPSLTDSGRWRADFAFDLKYDIPLDFYIKAGISYNYDNKPVEGATDSDYVFQLTFGWEW